MRPSLVPVLAALLTLSACAHGAVVISELLSHTDLPEVDWIELHNDGSMEVDISGWYLTDSPKNWTRYQFAPGTQLKAGEFKSFRETLFNPETYPGGFRFSSLGEQALIYDASAGQIPLSGPAPTPVDRFDFPASRNGRTFIRYKGGDGRVTRPFAARKTENARNSYPDVAGVVISAVNFAPGTGEDEFIRITSTAAIAQKLYDPDYPSTTFQIRGLWSDSTPPNGWKLPPSLEIAPGESIYFTGADPASFRTKLSLDASAQVYKWSANGSLSDSGRTVGLWAPDLPEQDIVYTAFYPLDEVHYGITAPWPTNTVASAYHLARISLVSYADDANNWRSTSAPPPTCSSSRDCPLIDACTVATCEDGACVFALRTCNRPDTQAEAEAYNRCFPPAPGGSECTAFVAPPPPTTGAAVHAAPLATLACALLAAAALA